jgi:hypothetical protein
MAVGDIDMLSSRQMATPANPSRTADPAGRSGVYATSHAFPASALATAREGAAIPGHPAVGVVCLGPLAAEDTLLAPDGTDVTGLPRLGGVRGVGERSNAGGKARGGVSGPEAEAGDWATGTGPEAGAGGWATGERARDARFGVRNAGLVAVLCSPTAGGDN